MNTGGLSAPLCAVAVRMVWEVAQAVKVPILGMGGVSKGEDAAMLIAGGGQCCGGGHPPVCRSLYPLKGPGRLAVLAAGQGLAAVRELTGKVLPW